MIQEKMKFRNILTVCYFVVSTVSFGGGTLQGIGNYAAWKLVGAQEFPAFHQAVDDRVFTFFVPIVFVSIPISILMIWFRHPAISRNLVIVAVLLNLFIFAVTVTLAIPIHAQLSQAKSAELIDKLVFYHNYLRTIPGLVLMFFNCLMLYEVVKKSEH